MILYAAISPARAFIGIPVTIPSQASLLKATGPIPAGTAHGLERCIDRAKDSVESNVSDRDIWIENIEANRLLVEGKGI